MSFRGAFVLITSYLILVALFVILYRQDFFSNEDLFSNGKLLIVQNGNHEKDVTAGELVRIEPILLNF